MPSTAIRRIGYAPDAKRLTVAFVSGRVYAYDGAPATLVAAFRAAPSKGAFFNAEIRGAFAYREITPARANRSAPGGAALPERRRRP